MGAKQHHNGRRFEFTAVRKADAGPRQAAATVSCSVCRQRGQVVSTGRSHVPPEFIVRKFADLGWAVGKRPADDICPRCLAKKQERKPVVTLLTTPKLVSPAPDRVMSRDDRRIIFAKLNDVYLDEKTGYSEGWSDERVATDLSVPRKWVEVIRAENFGEARDNEEIRKFLAEMRGLTTTQNTLAAQWEALKSRLGPLEILARKLEKLVH